MASCVAAQCLLEAQYSDAFTLHKVLASVFWQTSILTLLRGVRNEPFGAMRGSLVALVHLAMILCGVGAYIAGVSFTWALLFRAMHIPLTMIFTSPSHHSARQWILGAGVIPLGLYMFFAEEPHGEGMNSIAGTLLLTASVACQLLLVQAQTRPAWNTPSYDVAMMVLTCYSALWTSLGVGDLTYVLVQTLCVAEIQWINARLGPVRGSMVHVARRIVSIFISYGWQGSYGLWMACVGMVLYELDRRM